MQTYYPCILITKDEAENITGTPIRFTHGYLQNMQQRRQLEDALNQPVVSVRYSKRDATLLCCLAEGTVQTNPMTGKRLVILEGTAETLKTILSDIMTDCPDILPKDIFCAYGFRCSPNDRMILEDWRRHLPDTVRKEFRHD